MIITLLLIGTILPAAAAAGKNITVYPGVKIYVDDKQLNPADANGNPVDVFIYDGTTYLPVRAVSEAIGKPVQWDGATQSVYLGTHSSSSPTVYLSKLDYFAKSGTWMMNKVEKDNLGNEHTDAFYCLSYYNGSLTYKLNGQYRRLTGTFFQRYLYRDTRYDGCTLVVSGDGRELWRGKAEAGKDPVDLDIGLTGVLELTLDVTGVACEHTCFGEVALWP